MRLGHAVMANLQVPHQARPDDKLREAIECVGAAFDCLITSPLARR
jgi:hypothetical protein